MKKILLPAILFLLLSGTTLLVAQNVSTSTSSVLTHTIVKGDTLWDISKKNYNNPWLWTALWEVNKSTITNPHIIYVGQSVALPPKEELKKIKPSLPVPEFGIKSSVPSHKVVVASAVSKEKAPVEKQPSSPSDIYSGESAVTPTELSAAKTTDNIASVVNGEKNKNVTTDDASMAGREESSTSSVVRNENEISKSVAEKISPSAAAATAYPARVVGENYTPDGIIVGMKEEKLLTSQGDIVYASFPFTKVSVGDRLGIYRKTGKRIYNPSDGSYLGNELVRVGTAGIENISSSKSDGGISTAIVRILVSSEPIEKKDWLILEK